MAALTKLETDVSQFVTAMQHANSQLALLKSPPQTFTANNTPTPRNDLTAQILKAIEGEKAAANMQKVAAFEAMRREWLQWGQGVMRTLELWMERRDVGITDRVRVMGLADRLAWYGVKAR